MIFRLLLVLIALLPLPIASVYPWTWSAMAVVVAFLLIAFVASIRSIDARHLPRLRRLALPVLSFFVVAFFAALQMDTHLPAKFHNPLWQATADSLNISIKGAISIAPDETGSALMRLLTYAGIFWIALHYCRSPKLARQTIYVLVATGFAYATYGLFIELTQSRLILWFDKTSYMTDLTSTFVNRNSYATYAGFGLVCCTALLLELINNAQRTGLTPRERTLRLTQAMTEHGWLFVVAWLVMSTALLFTHSRAGLASTVLGLVALLATFAAAPGTRIRVFLATATPLLIAGIALLAFSGEVVTERLIETDIENVGRLRAYELSLEAIAANPLFGTGYGTFEDAFHAYRDETLPAVFDKAHNTYLENALELGIPAVAILLVSLGTLLVQCVIGARSRRRDTVYPCIGVGATVLLAAHSLVDFSAQIPAVAATYALIMGVAVAQSWRTSKAS